MKIIYLLLAGALFLCSCKKEKIPAPEIISFTPDKGSFNNTVIITGKRFDSSIINAKVAFNGAVATIVSLSDTVIKVIVPQNATTGKITVTANGRTGVSLTDFIFLPGKWTKKADLPIDKGRVVGIGFSIGNKGYLAMGSRVGLTPPNNVRLNDVMEYDPASNTWIERASLANLRLASGIGMVINNKFYTGIGETDQGYHTNQFWEYEPITNQWTRKADFPGIKRRNAISFGLGNKGYVGTGLDSSLNGLQLQDWWQYDPVTNTWTRKADYPAGLRHFVTGFVLNNKIYAGMGTAPISVYPKDWWEYDGNTDQWTRKKDFPGKMIWGAYGFSIGNKGYVMAAGYECWEYNPSSDNWTQRAFFDYRYLGAAFSIGNKGYYTTGLNSGFVLFNDLWEFDPSQ